MTNNEDRIEILEDAKEKLIEVIDLVRQATRRTDEEMRVDSYILPHLSTWVDDARGSSGTAIESLLEIFRGDNDDPEDDDDDEHSPDVEVGRMSNFDVFEEKTGLKVPEGARTAKENEDGSFFGNDYSLKEILAMTDGPKKKFYLMRHINVNFPETSKGTTLKEFSCKELVDALETYSLSGVKENDGDYLPKI